MKKVKVKLQYRDRNNAVTQFLQTLSVPEEKVEKIHRLERNGCPDLEFGQYGIMPANKFFGSVLHQLPFNNKIDHTQLEVGQIIKVTDNISVAA